MNVKENTYTRNVSGDARNVVKKEPRKGVVGEVLQPRPTGGHGGTRRWA